MPGNYGRRGRARRRRSDAARLAVTARFFLCGRCRAQVLICSHCDRGQIYCGERCAGAARRNSLRAAGRRYQASRRGRFAHAARARCYRRRKNVTHQGSPADWLNALLPAAPAASDPARGSGGGATAAAALVHPWSVAIFAAAAAPGTVSEDLAVTIPAELEAQILRYHHVEKWPVGTIAKHLVCLPQCCDFIR